jgi:membrane protease YdiL (CAAX protease family)
MISTKLKQYNIFLWILLLMITGYICFLNQSAKQNKAHEINKVRISPVINILGRYGIGIKSLNRAEKQAENPENLNLQIIQDARKLAVKPIDKICLAPFIAELISTVAAREYIRGLKLNEKLPDNLSHDLIQFEKIYTEGTDFLAPAEQKDLITRYNWAGKIALSHGLSDDTPERASLLKEAENTFLQFLFLITFFFTALFLGCILMIVSIKNLVQKQTILSFSRAKIEKYSEKKYQLMEMMVLFFLIKQGMEIFDNLPQVITWLIYFLILPSLLFWPRIRGMNFQELTYFLGWHKGKGVIKEVLAGITGYLTGLPLIITGILITVQLVQQTGIYPVHPIIYEFSNADLTKTAELLFLACILAPVLEESLFRGAFYSYLRLNNSIILSAAVTGLIFAAIHPQGLIAIPALTCIGIVFSLIREWRDSLIASISAHALNNFTITIILILNS